MKSNSMPVLQSVTQPIGVRVKNEGKPFGGREL